MHLSIITPSLNYGRFLSDCLESVATQEGVEVEHFIFDAGSTDGSAAVAARFPHVTWIQEADEGMSDAINKGFDRASGDWVMWLNADDRLKPGALAEIAKVLAETPADVVYGTWDFIDEDGRFIRRMKLFDWSPFVNIHHCCYVPSTACFLRRTTTLAEGVRLHPEFRYLMDGELYARLHAAGKKFHYEPVVLADFRLHGGNLSSSTDSTSRNIDEVLKAERHHVESRAIRRVYGITFFADPYLNGLVDGFLYLAAHAWKIFRKLIAPCVRLPEI